ncbi:MAG: beta-hydroxyacyl-ACP dehydratase [Spirochaetales bacterium]|nr:beta-hydroxyacyl-ACP dehydratase [Spirochaetales bacterium]
MNIGRDGIERIIPQRDPILYVDRLTGVDLDAGVISGERWIDPADPVFNGHFPEYPVYPGTYIVEMIGQLGLCLYYFLENKTDSISPEAKPLPLRATRILGASFMEPILPGRTVTLLAKKLEFDGFLATAVGQAIVDGKVACVSIGEVAFLA